MLLNQNGFYIVAFLLGAIGQYLYKTVADSSVGNIKGYLLNPRIIGGVLCYISVMVLFVAAFKKGGSLAVLYPVYATTFVWAALISWYMFGLPIKPVNVAGMAFLILGIYLMGKN